MQTTEFDVRAYATAVARYGLYGAEPPAAVGDQNWSLALATLADEKVLGIACAAATDGWLRLDADQYAELVGRQRQAMAWCLGLERRLQQIADAFDGAGVDFVVLKGPALAHTVYPDPSWRTFNDLDVLVRTSQWRAAVEVLQGEFGWPRRLPEPRRGFDERFGKAAVFTTDTGQQIDLHRNLAQGPFGVWIDGDELFDRAATFDTAGWSLRRPGDTDLFVHACIHEVLGGASPRAIQVRDVVQTMHLGALDPALMSSMLRRWRLSAVVMRALDAIPSHGREAAHSFVMGLAQATQTRQHVEALDAHDRARNGGLRSALRTVRAVPGVRERIAFATSLAFPSRDFLRSRAGSDGVLARISRLRAAARRTSAPARGRSR
jgi:hypothetical protein